MANIVYADPFGSYVKGQEQGQRQAIELGKAQREFRDADTEAEFRKWYDPHRRGEALMKEQQEQMATNQLHLQTLARLAASGNPKAQELFASFAKESMGIDIDFSKKTPEQAAWMEGIIAGDIPLAMANKDVFAAGHGTVQRYGHGDSAMGPMGVSPPNALFGNNADWLHQGEQGTANKQETPNAGLPYLPAPLGPPAAVPVVPATPVAKKPFWNTEQVTAPVSEPAPPAQTDQQVNPYDKNVLVPPVIPTGTAMAGKTTGAFETEGETGYSTPVNHPAAPTQYGKPSVTVGAPITLPKSVTPSWVNTPTPGESPWVGGTDRVRGATKRTVQ